MTVVVKRKSEVTGRDVLGFRPEWLETWKEWVNMVWFLIPATMMRVKREK